ncbi:MAG: hypothetical protein ACRECJ_02350, partial [Limisphaerales bacterium]
GYAYRVNSIDGALGGTINGAIDAPGMSSKIRFHYNDVSEFPSASAYHGMFAHAHNQGAAYYAHAAQWVRLADSAHLHSSLAASDLFPNPALSVDAVGNVGIGTTNPTKKLEVAGSIKGDTIFSNVLSSNSPLSLQAPAGTTRMFIDDATGKVGIEVSNPLNTLTIGSNGAFTSTGLFQGILMGTSSSQTKQLIIGRDEGNFVQLAYADDLFSPSARLLVQGNHPLSITTGGSLYLSTGGINRIFVSNVGNVGIGTTSPGASNLLELSSTTKGFVLPRMTKTERDAIASPVAGMMIYQTDNTPGLRVHNGTNWMRFTETAD